MVDLARTQIGKNGKKWNTGPERLFNAFQRARKLGLIQDVHLPLLIEGKTVEYQLDFARPVDYENYLVTGFHDPNTGFDVDFEIDGTKHDRKLDPLKDYTKSRHGLKVIHIPGRLCRKENWGRLESLVRKALLSEKLIVNLRHDTNSS